MLSKMSQTFLFLVKTGIFYEFSKLVLFAPRPSERKSVKYYEASCLKTEHKARVQVSYTNNLQFNSYYRSAEQVIIATSGRKFRC